MGKTSSYLVLITGLVLVAVGAIAVHRFGDGGSSPKSEPNFDRVLTLFVAHGGRSDREWKRFFQEGTLRYYPHLSPGSQSFERRLSLATDGPLVRYDKATLEKSQSFVFDGNTLVRTTSEHGTRVEVKALNEVEAAGIKFQIITSGLLPILKGISDPSSKVICLGTTSNGDRFEVKTVNGSWYFHSNVSHLIERVEMGEIKITYSDYRTVDGVTLPYYQKVQEGDRFLYDIKFESFDLERVFETGFFES